MTRSSGVVAAALLASLSGAGSAEDTLGRPQSIGFTRTGWISWVDRDGDFSFGRLTGLDCCAQLSGQFPNATPLRGRDGEPCTQAAGHVFCDRNRDGLWNGNAGGDLGSYFSIATPGALAYHDVVGEGVRQLVKYVPALGGRDEFRLDANRNDRWDGPEGGDAIHLVAPDAGPGTPLACDHDGDGAVELGKVLADGSTLAIDGDDALRPFGGATGPGLFLCADLDGVPGDEIVKYVPDLLGQDRFLVDANRNRRWDGVAGGDTWRLVASRAGPGQPFAIDPDGDGVSVLGKHRAADGWVTIDLDGDGVWRGDAGGDLARRFNPGLFRPPLQVYDRAP